MNTLKIKERGKADFRLKKKELAKHWRKDRRDRAALLVEFLGYRFNQSKRALPRSWQLDYWLKFYKMNKPQNLKAVVSIQADLKKLLGNALDALADSDPVGERMSRLIEAFAALKGAPYVYERNLVEGSGQLGDRWIRRPVVEPGSLRNFFLSLAAGLFDAGKINLLGHCQHCERFFVTKGHGRPPKYCDRCDSNKRLGKEWFQGYYKTQKQREIRQAREFWNKGLRGKKLIEKLRAKRMKIGKTILRNEGLWDDKEDSE